MSTIRLRWFIAVAVLALTAVLAAAAPRLGARAWGEEGGRELASPGALLPTYALRARLSGFSGGDPISIVADPSRNRLYISFEHSNPHSDAGSTLAIVDTRQAKVLKIFDNIELTQLILTQDHKYVIGFTQYPVEPGKFVVIDAAAMQIVDEIPVTCAPTTTNCSVGDMDAGPEGRLYWIGYQDTLVNVLDVATGEILDRFEAGDESTIVGIEIADGKLFANEPVDYNSSRDLWRYDISTPVAVHELTTKDEYGIYSLLAAPDGTYLLGGTDFGLFQYSAETLKPTRELSAQQYRSTTTGGRSISPDSRRIVRLFVELNQTQQYIHAIDAINGEVVNEGIVDVSQTGNHGFDYRMIALANGGVAVAFPGYVDLYAATHHATALPVAFANHCPGGPFRDNFSDPNSGWPNTTGGSITVDYVENQYRIRQQEANRWFGVTRGDKWLGGEMVAVDTRVIAATGFSGIIYGLNDDWSRFHTFEVYPSLGRWAVFEFNEATGWALRATDTHYAIKPAGQWNRLMITYISLDKVWLEVNGSWVDTVTNQDGRVGLSAGSLEPGFEARYDNYEFVGKNCGWGERATSVEVAQYLERAPLDDFLK